MPSRIRVRLEAIEAALLARRWPLCCEELLFPSEGAVVVVRRRRGLLDDGDGETEGGDWCHDCCCDDEDGRAGEDVMYDEDPRDPRCSLGRDERWLSGPDDEGFEVYGKWRESLGDGDGDRGGRGEA
jgi:hypothetical protein